MLRLLLSILLTIGMGSIAQAGDFKITFSWDGLKRCTTGRTYVVANPIFIVSNLPEGMVGVDFRLKDLNVPSYNHGDGWIEISKDEKVAESSFKYKSPCPPNGKHKYQWTAKAKDKKGFVGKTLATAQASRTYPD